MATTKKPWHAYKIGSPSTRANWVEPTCRPCTEVSHVSHVETALRIVGAKQIKQGLVFDESMLNTERILVTWLSPNSWVNGFRYGNVRFTYNFADLIKDKHFYWVEDMTAYNPTACRILITSTDRSASLPTYDPNRGDGPWWFDSSSGTHYINGNYCLEFMVEDDLKVRKATGVDFVKHHSEWCSEHRTSPKDCDELGLSNGKGGARFLMLAAGRGVDLSLLRKSLIEEDGELSYRVKDALGWVAHKFQKLNYSANVKASSDTGKAVARAVLNALAIGQKSEADLLASMFYSEGSLTKALASVIGESLGWDDTDAIRSAMS